MAEARAAASVGDPDEIERALQLLLIDANLESIATMAPKEGARFIVDALRPQQSPDDSSSTAASDDSNISSSASTDDSTSVSSRCSHRSRGSTATRVRSERLQNELEMKRMEVKLKKLELKSKRLDQELEKMRFHNEAEASRRADEIRLAELRYENDERAREADRLRAEMEDSARQREEEVRKMELHHQVVRTKLIYNVVKYIAIGGAVVAAIYFAPAVLEAVAIHGPTITQTLVCTAERLAVAAAQIGGRTAVTAAQAAGGAQMLRGIRL